MIEGSLFVDSNSCSISEMARRRTYQERLVETRLGGLLFSHYHAAQ